MIININQNLDFKVVEDTEELQMRVVKLAPNDDAQTAIVLQLLYHDYKHKSLPHLIFESLYRLHNFVLLNFKYIFLD
jgi:hypothetical protein